MRDSDGTRILDWPGYRVYRHEVNERAMTLRAFCVVSEKGARCDATEQ